MSDLSLTAAAWPAESADRRSERCRAWLIQRGLLTSNESAAVKGRMKKRRKRK
jgi:hypothetical protein